jgi:LysW-gamma-L-lysine carboxypeptidase
MTMPPIAELLEGLVAIPSLSGDERRASEWLVARMTDAGYNRTFVDEAGNAVGELGEPDATRTVVLLGHIDTVAGVVPVRVEGAGDEARLFGRGSVDAKGPLATFAAAGARLGGDWAREHGLRLVVVGAVEEESATSKGARHIAARFDGHGEPMPDACVIGEPSRWNRVTLGYKGRLLLELEAEREMTHTAGPEAGIGTVGVAFWNLLDAHAVHFNEGRDKAFAQLLPSLRSIATDSNGLVETVRVEAGLRLPLDFEPAGLLDELARWSGASTGAPVPGWPTPEPGSSASMEASGDTLTLRLATRGYEPAWRSERSSPLVRSFMAAIRANEGGRPGLVVKTGTSDMNVVGPVWNCPILAYGPGDSSLDHTPHEHVHLRELEAAVTVLEAALRSLASELAG